MKNMKINHNDIPWSKTLPEYANFQDMIIAAIDVPKDAPLHSIEFGIGSADTTKRFLHSYPEARLSMVDECSATLENVHSSFTDDIQAKTHIINSRFQDFHTSEKFDLSFTALSLHHLKRSEQIELYQKIYNALVDGGLLVIGDLFKSEDFDFQMSTNLTYIQHRSSTLSESEQTAFSEHLTSDNHYFYECVAVIEWLRLIGFSAIDISWCHRSLSVIRAVK
jgi:tRNA (cmo5U34)-methyltransferase